MAPSVGLPMPCVSVIISVYDNCRELPRAMDSLLSQTFQDFEVIAMDDGSTDGSGALLDGYAAQDSRVRVIHQENSGLGPALQRACLTARGQYLARQDADDVSAPTRLERQVAYMDCHNDVVVCGTWAWIIDSERGPLHAWEVPDDGRLLTKILESGSNPLIHGSVMIRKAAYDKEGQGYRLRGISEEYDLWLRLSDFGRLGILPSVEYLYWMSVSGISYGGVLTRGKLRDLCLQLHAERKKFGCERTDWRQQEDMILASVPIEPDPVVRQTIASYARGVEALRAAQWSDFRGHMARAARGQGTFAAKAKWRLRLAWIAPFIRWLYRRRDAKGVRPFVRFLEPNTPLPTYVSVNEPRK
jgi:glycosyltransferase involved in cell wall biosynthesis